MYQFASQVHGSLKLASMLTLNANLKNKSLKILKFSGVFQLSLMYIEPYAVFEMMMFFFFTIHACIDSHLILIRQ